MTEEAARPGRGGAAKGGGGIKGRASPPAGSSQLMQGLPNSRLLTPGNYGPSTRGGPPRAPPGREEIWGAKKGGLYVNDVGGLRDGLLFSFDTHAPAGTEDTPDGGIGGKHSRSQTGDQFSARTAGGCFGTPNLPITRPASEAFPMPC